MSRIGRMPIEIPTGVSVDIKDGSITVRGPKGELTEKLLDQVNVKVENSNIEVTRKNDEKIAKGQHGLMRTLIANMVEGVTKGFKKQLEVNGVGFKVSSSGQKLNMSLGFSHPVEYLVPQGLTVSVDGNTITLEGSHKQLLGQTAAEIRKLKKPEPYKGKGIKYVEEHIVRKAGKTAGGGE